MDLSRKIIIAIDGYSSCGKSSFAKQIANSLGYVFIDTGAMYRAVTLFLIEEGSAITKDNKLDKKRVIELLDKIDISFRYNASRGASDVYTNSVLVEDKIRSIEVSEMVSAVSTIDKVRQKLVTLQQAMGKDKGVVMDGRDIGTVVFPGAELKIFMTADPAIRAQRRYAELKAKGEDVSIEQIIENINTRDKNDRERAISPLRKAGDAIELDNSHMSQDDQMVWFKELINNLKD